MNKDLDHLKLLSIFHYVLAGLCIFPLLYGVFYMVIGIFAGVMIASAPNSNNNGPPAALFGGIFVLIGGVIAVIALVIGFLFIKTGRNLSKQQSYNFCFVIACISCLIMPFGTILGIFTIIVLSRPSVKEIFNGQNFSSSQSAKFTMSFEAEGFAVLENTIDEQKILSLLEDLSHLQVNQRNKGVYGVRNLLNLSPQVREFAEGKLVREIAEEYLGKSAKVVRAIYFDKTLNANWKVPWHQDLTIAVAEKTETIGFTAWSVKEHIHHVQPPIEFLERMLTLRFHLDDADESNGALKVLSKTHKFGRLSATEIQNLKSKQSVRWCKVKKGDCLLMKPLLVHSSSAGTIPQNRRIIHLEFSADDLPNGLQFYGS